MELRNKVAVVTGGGAGIGRGLALALAERQCRVVVADIEQAPAEAVAREIVEQGGTALAITCDVRQYRSVEALADAAWQHFGEVHLLFNNAGVAAATPAGVIQAEPLDLEWVLSVNVVGVWNGCSVFGKRFLQQGTPSHIVNTCSEHSFGLAHAGQGFYTASKQAVLGLSEVMYAELPPHVGISVLCPGLVQSELWNAARNRPEKPDSALETLKALGKAILERGMPAIEVGRKALEGVERGDFFIVTHPHSRGIAEKRWQEIAAAFDAQAPHRPGEPSYEFNAVAQSVLEEAQRAASGGCPFKHA